MPSPIQRDPAETRRSLTEWLGRTFPDAGPITVTDVRIPSSSGFSGETLLVDAEWGGEAQALVVRVAPTTYTVFLDADFEAQYLAMKVVSEHTDVPMPEMLAFEGDPAWLGSAFSLMRRVEGEAAPDSPPYTESGWVVDATTEQRARMYDSGLRAMAAVHATDWQGLGLGERLDRDEFAYVEDYYAWALRESGLDNPVMEEAMAWVRANRPEPPTERALCWGDARPGNQLFADFEVSAVLDWEMVEVGDPLMDVAWWLFLQRYHTIGSGLPLPSGFLTEDEVVARWSELTGRTVDPATLHFYLVWAGIRFGIVMMRLGTLFKLFGLLPEEVPMESQNPVLDLLRALLHEEA
jgi:aminoglycoside phosphotransferase (APT) family kinase protein